MTVHVSNQGPQSFTERISSLHRDFVREGVPVADMRRSPALELQFAGSGDIATRPSHLSGRAGIEPVEGPIEARRVPVAVARESRIRYFLDGAQRTFAVWRCGLIPIAATVAAAGVLRRDPTGDGVLEPGTLAMKHVMLIPNLPDPRVQDLRVRIEDSGIEVNDPLPSGADTAGAPVDYGQLHELAYIKARDVRADLEERVLDTWAAAHGWGETGDWIIVDGRNRLNHPRVIGLVKQFSETYLTGEEAETLYGLPPGFRTTAFIPEVSRRYGNEGGQRLMWYIRLWDAEGMDARHALVRIEASANISTSDEIDEISSWILAERTPRATGDARWATLLYPVHLLERMLKRRLDADTRGWPGA